MKFIIYYDKNISRLGSVLRNSVQENWKGFDIETLTTVKSLMGRVSRHGSTINAIYIFMVDSKSRLIELIHFNHLMEDKRLIILVPEESEETMRLSMLLSPRYIAKISDEYDDLHLVLERMVKYDTFGSKTQ